MKVAIIGAGSIGCHVGGRLASNPDIELTLVGRPRILDQLAEHGLTVGTPDGPRETIPPDRITTTTDSADPSVTSADLAIVTVKAIDTLHAGKSLAWTLPLTTPVLCLQNGLRGTETLAGAMPDHRVFAGMVAYNVVQEPPATFLRTTSGEIMVEDDPALHPLIAAAAAATSPLTLVPRTDMAGVHAAKLLLNLNNAINALSGIPLEDELADRNFRRILAACQREALAVYAGCGISTAKLTPVPPQVMTRVLELPTPLFKLLTRTALVSRV